MEQAEATWSGTHLAERIEGEFTISLYQIDGFYVEVYYHRENNMIQRFRSFSSTNQLDPYLQQISIDNT
jgi:hypothetical protein